MAFERHAMGLGRLATVDGGRPIDGYRRATIGCRRVEMSCGERSPSIIVKPLFARVRLGFYYDGLAGVQRFSWTMSKLERVPENLERPRNGATRGPWRGGRWARGIGPRASRPAAAVPCGRPLERRGRPCGGAR